METYKNSSGEDCVLIASQDGSMWSGLKSVYDAQQATPVIDPLPIADSVISTEVTAL